LDDQAYRVAASTRLGEERAIERGVGELRQPFPDFDPARFAKSLPYEHDVDRDALLDALRAAEDSPESE